LNNENQKKQSLQNGSLYFDRNSYNTSFGGSAGREGTAVKMGGAIADQFTKLFALDTSDRKQLSSGSGRICICFRNTFGRSFVCIRSTFTLVKLVTKVFYYLLWLMLYFTVELWGCTYHYMNSLCTRPALLYYGY
jgi:H+/Cl- antiporter ClcA